MTQERKQVGQFGEETAMVYLRKKGYVVLERNFRCPFGELDLIAKNRGVLIFIEVKTRNSKSFGTPAEAVDARKRKHLFLAASYYMKVRNYKKADCRFDVIEVVMDKTRYTVNHIENAFWEEV